MGGTCSMQARDEKFLDFGRKTWTEETTQKTKV